jgi:hypothetical protein
MKTITQTICCRVRAIVLTLVASAHCWVATSDTLVLPPDFASSEAPGVNSDPFGSTGDFRSEQIFSPSLVPLLPLPGSFYQIKEVAFRLNGSGPDQVFSSGTFEKVQLYMSTSPREFPSGFVVDMDQNHGPDKTLIFNEGILLSGTAPPGGPGPFDIRFKLSTPFGYDPKNGSLVLDIWKYGSATLAALDNGGSGTLFYSGKHDGSFTQRLGGGALVTEFTYEVVPEPIPVSIFSLGTLLIIAIKRTFSQKGIR